MMARSTRGSNQRPDTLMQDRTSANSMKVLLQRTAGPYIWVISRPHAVTRPCPLYPQKRTLSDTTRMSALCQKRTNAPQEKSRYSITASARASNFQNGCFLSSQWFPNKATSAQTNSRAPSVVLNQIDDLWSPSTFHRARDRRSSCRILACHPVTHAKIRLSCGAHPPCSRRPGHFRLQAIELRSARAAGPGKQGPRQCLEVWSCLPLQENGRKFSSQLHGWTERLEAASCKNVRSTEKEYHSHVVNSL